jgi:hypothetical protein
MRGACPCHHLNARTANAKTIGFQFLVKEESDQVDATDGRLSEFSVESNCRRAADSLQTIDGVLIEHQLKVVHGEIPTDQ